MGKDLAPQSNPAGVHPRTGQQPLSSDRGPVGLGPWPLGFLACVVTQSGHAGMGKVLPELQVSSPVLGQELCHGSGASWGRVSPSFSHSSPWVPWAVQEEELVELLARHCYVQLGASVESKAVQELLPSCIPHRLYRTKPPDGWASLVTAACAKVSLHAAQAPSQGLSFRRWGARGVRGDGLPPHNPHPLGNNKLQLDR